MVCDLPDAFPYRPHGCTNMLTHAIRGTYADTYTHAVVLCACTYVCSPGLGGCGTSEGRTVGPAEESGPTADGTGRLGKGRKQPEGVGP